MRSDNLKSVVSVADPAIDRENSNFSKYLVTRDEKYLRFHAGKQPARFRIRRIPRSLLLKYVERTDDITTKHVRAFECAVVEIENMYDDKGGQRPNVFSPKWTERPDEGVAAMTPDELDQVEPSDILDVGGVAYAHAFLRRGRSACYPVQRSYLPVLEMANLPPVEEVLEALDRSNDESQLESPAKSDSAGE